MPSSLSAEFLARVQALKETFDEVYPKSYEDWVEGFEQDGAPARELFIWECMALTYQNFVTSQPWPMEAKEEALSVILRYSAGTSEEQLLKTKQKILHSVEILGLIDSFKAATEAISAISRGKRTK